MFRIGRWIPAAALMAVIFMASEIPGSRMPELGYWDVLAKKIGHMIGYALLAAAYSYALNAGKKAESPRLLLPACLAILYAISDELHQSYTPGRTPSAWDVLIDAAGAVIGAFIWRRLRIRFRNPHRNAP